MRSKPGRTVIFAVLLALLAAPGMAGDSRFASLPGDPGLHSASALVLDANGGLIYGKDIDTVRPIASITKLMTAMVVLDAGLDLAKMLSAARQYPLIREASAITDSEVHPYRQQGPLMFNNTNRLLKNGEWRIDLSKTGYLHEAGRCLVMQAEIEGELVSIVLLNSFGKLTPFGDSNRLRKWMLASG